MTCCRLHDNGRARAKLPGPGACTPYTPTHIRSPQCSECWELGFLKGVGMVRNYRALLGTLVLLASNDHLGNANELGPGEFNEINRCSVILGCLVTRSCWTKDLGTDQSGIACLSSEIASSSDSYFHLNYLKDYLSAEVWPEAGVISILRLENEVRGIQQD